MLRCERDGKAPLFLSKHCFMEIIMPTTTPRSNKPLKYAMTLCLLTTGFMFGTSMEEANARSSTKSFTCEGVKDLVYDRGAIVLNTKNRNVYRRFVANRSFCQVEEIVKSYRVPTRTGSCRLLICREITYRRNGFGSN